MFNCSLLRITEKIITVILVYIHIIVQTLSEPVRIIYPPFTCSKLPLAKSMHGTQGICANISLANENQLHATNRCRYPYLQTILSNSSLAVGNTVQNMVVKLIAQVSRCRRINAVDLRATINNDGNGRQIKY